MLQKVIWENILQNNCGILYRSKVPGGWLIKEVQDVRSFIQGPQVYDTGYEWTTSICFMPDPTHKWLKEEISLEDPNNEIKAHVASMNC